MMSGRVKREFVDDEAEMSGDDDASSDEYEDSEDGLEDDGGDEEDLPLVDKQHRLDSELRGLDMDEEDAELNAYRKKLFGHDYELQKKEKVEKINPKSFIEDEAELSGDDEVSSDENEDDDDDDENQDDENAEQLPSDDEQQALNERVFKKQELDDDILKVKLLEERFIKRHEEESVQRNKTFRWQNADNDVWLDDFADSDESDDEGDAPQFEDQGVKINYKSSSVAGASGEAAFVVPDEEAGTTVMDEDDSVSNDTAAAGAVTVIRRTAAPAPELKSSRLGTMRAFSGPANSILSYVVKDKKTHELLSKKAISPKNPLKRPIKRLKTTTTKLANSRKAKVANGGAGENTKPTGPNMLQLLSQFE